MNNNLVVIKVGGSLLDWPELPDRLRAFLTRHERSRVVLLAGGGRIVDAIRDLDRVCALGDEFAHWLAIDALSLTARILAARVVELSLIDDINILPMIWDSGRIPILAPARFLREDTASPDPLPATWDVTSDSIAAQVAVRLRADEIVLLKSTPAASPSFGEAVDAYFSRASSGIPRVTFHDLRGGIETEWGIGRRPIGDLS